MQGKLSAWRFGTGLAVVLLSALLFVAMLALTISVAFLLTPTEQMEFFTADGWWLCFGMAALGNVLVWITLFDILSKCRRLGRTFRSAIPAMACVLMFNLAATTFYWSRELWRRPTA
jgi:hypothetical protein